jgi:DNA mismatch endonuclease, patch repair protein
MAAVRSKDTRPEMLVRQLVHCMGYRYRLHRKDLPGKPDLVFVSRKAVVFVHGCFWHSHDCAKGRKRPMANGEWWHRKLEKNQVRDRSTIESLEEKGWRVLVIWECEAKAGESLSDKLRAFLR